MPSPVIQSCSCKGLQVLSIGVAAGNECAVMRGKQPHTLAGQGVQLRLVRARRDGEAEGTTWVVANLQQTTAESSQSEGKIIQAMECHVVVADGVAAAAV